MSETAARRRPRLLVLTQVYRPEPNFITADVAEAMTRSFDVTVVTAHPNYPHDWFYPGTRWWWPARTEEKGVTVWRVPMLPYHGASKTRRAVCYLSFVLAAALTALAVARRPHTVWVYHGAFTVALAALPLRLFGRPRVVYTCADLWPESFVAAGVARPGRLMDLLFAYSRWINRRADVLIGSTEGTLDRFERDGLPRNRLWHVPVWVEGASQPTPQGYTDDSMPRRVVYVGNIGPAQKLDTLVIAAARLREEGLPVTFDVYGSGSMEDDLAELSRRMCAPVTFHGRIDPAEAFRVSTTAWAQVVSLQPSPYFAMTVPSKLAFCCAAATPVLYGLIGESARIMEHTGGGVAFDVADPGSFVDAVKVLMSRRADERRLMRRSLRNYYEEHFAPSGLLAQYERILVGAAGTDDLALR